MKTNYKYRLVINQKALVEIPEFESLDFLDAIVFDVIDNMFKAHATHKLNLHQTDYENERYYCFDKIAITEQLPELKKHFKNPERKVMQCIKNLNLCDVITYNSIGSRDKNCLLINKGLFYNDLLYTHNNQNNVQHKKYEPKKNNVVGFKIG